VGGGGSNLNLQIQGLSNLGVIDDPSYTRIQYLRERRCKVKVFIDAVEADSTLIKGKKVKT
jgi:hypothetical protein